MTEDMYPGTPTVYEGDSQTPVEFFQQHSYRLMGAASEEKGTEKVTENIEFFQALRDSALLVAQRSAALVLSLRYSFASEDGKLSAAATKSSEVDPVTVVDKRNEDFIREELLRDWPESVVLGEENGEVSSSINQDVINPSTGRGVTWIVDPIDGTVNFMYDLGNYSISIAAECEGSIVAAVVVDIVAFRIYVASLGGGAYVIDLSEGYEPPREWEVLASQARRLDRNMPDSSCSDATASASIVPQSISRALLATGFSYLSARREKQAELLVGILPLVRDIRRMGSAALDLCHVAEGSVDAFYEHGLGPWDHSAGALIAAEAGVAVAVPPKTVSSGDGMIILAAEKGNFDFLSSWIIQGKNGGILEPSKKS